jgi:hypothetical protein
MSRLTRRQRAERKAQLATRAALDRMRMTLALHAVRTTMAPSVPAGPSPLRRPLLALLIGIAAKRVEPARLRRLLRVASFALAAYRIVSTLRR